MSREDFILAEKNKYWVGILYPENMLPDWQHKIDDLLELPYAYCVHTMDKDTKSEQRKDHVHLIIAWNNTTTKNHAYSVFDRLSAPGKICCPGIQPVIYIRNKYDYLIHDTEGCRKAGKELYPKEVRITGNGFDIGLYEQVSQQDKDEAFKELSKFIISRKIQNYVDFATCVLEAEDFQQPKYLECLKSYSGHFDRLCKGNYLKWQEAKNKK